MKDNETKLNNENLYERDNKQEEKVVKEELQLLSEKVKINYEEEK